MITLVYPATSTASTRYSSRSVEYSQIGYRCPVHIGRCPDGEMVTTCLPVRACRLPLDVLLQQYSCCMPSSTSAERFGRLHSHTAHCYDAKCWVLNLTILVPVLVQLKKKLRSTVPRVLITTAVAKYNGDRSSEWPSRSGSKGTIVRPTLHHTSYSIIWYEACTYEIRNTYHTTVLCITRSMKYFLRSTSYIHRIILRTSTSTSYYIQGFGG